MTFLAVVLTWAFAAVFAASIAGKLHRAEATVAAFRKLGLGMAAGPAVVISLVGEGAVVAALAARQIAPALAAGGLLLMAFGGGGLALVKAHRSSSTLECGCLGGIGALTVSRGSSALSLAVGSLGLTVAILLAIESQPTSIGSADAIAAAAAGLSVGAVYWTAHYVISVQGRLRAAYEQVVR